MSLRRCLPLLCAALATGCMSMPPPHPRALEANELCAQYLKKGREVYVEGRIQTRQWDDKNTGQKKYSTEIVGNTMKMLGSRGESGGMAAAASASGHSSPDAEFNQTGADDVGSGAPGPDISDEDIPF